jgi:Flp pilus assembly protein TadG
MKSLKHLHRDERGMSFVYVGMGFMAFLSATTLAIDVGMFMTARAQTQNAADAGALAGAIALAKDDYDNRSSTGPAVQAAINTGKSNQVMGGAPSIIAADVTFPLGPTGINNRVKVQAHRSTERGNALPTMMGSLFGVKTVSLNAEAVAEASPANAETCVMPFTIPDKWKEKQDPQWTPNSTFDIVDAKNKPLANPDVYIGPSDKANYTGYNAQRDKGIEIVLKANNTSKVTSSFYNPWDLPGSVGASDYRSNIAGCNPAVIDLNKEYPPENGNMVGPTAQGMKDLIDKDPGAYWDLSCNCVKGSKYGEHSPRIVIIPLYDPVVFVNGPQHGKNIELNFVNFLGFFIEPMKNGEVIGRITPVGGMLDKTAGPAPAGAFPYVIRLVQ